MKLRYLFLGVLLALVMLVVASAGATPANPPSIDSGPSGTVATNDATFTFSSSEAGVTGFQCSRDDNGFVACNEGSITYNNLGEGSHKFEVRAVDADGPGPVATRNWTVDTPDPPVNTSPPTISGTARQGETLTADKGNWNPAGDSYSYQWRRCDSSGDNCTNVGSDNTTYNLTANDVGHRMRVQVTATNNDGQDTATSAATAVVDPPPDNTPPTVTIVSANPNALGPGDPNTQITWRANENGQFEVRVGGAGCNSGTLAASGNYGGAPNGNRTDTVGAGELSQGSNTVRVCVTDGNNNTGFETVNVTKDTAPPNTTITAKPPLLTDDDSADFDYDSTEPGSTFECKLNAGDFAACPVAGKSYSNLSDGQHVFLVRATDSAGNTDATAESHTWTVDTTNPQTTINTAPATPTNQTQATFEFVSNEGGSFRCELDGDVDNNCPSPATFDELSPGNHTFEVQAIDLAGNVDPTPATHTWEIDLTPGTSMRNVTAKAGDGVVLLRYAFPPLREGADIDRVVIRRNPPALTQVFKVRQRAWADRFRDRNVRNGRCYTYELRSRDRAGNESGPVRVEACPRDPLIAPRDGARIRRARPPLFLWAGVAGAQNYNIQVYRCLTSDPTVRFCSNRKQILGSGQAFPRDPQYRPSRSWARRHLRKGALYNWFVYPWFGQGRGYGKLIGQNWFRVRG